jgi:hypothetical protein
MLDKANPSLVTRGMVRGLKPCPTIGKRLWSQVGSVIEIGECVLIEGNDHIASRKETAPRFWRAAKLHLLCGLAGLALHGCPLDGQADAEVFGLDSSSSSKHKMACMWCNSRPRPGLSVTQEGPESSRKTRRVTRHFSRRP